MNDLNSLMVQAGDFLDGIDSVREKNEVGFNSYDKTAWPHARGNTKAMASILKKYLATQLVSKFPELIEIEKIELTSNVVPEWRRAGLFLVVDFLGGGKFNSFKDACKAAGLWFDGGSKCWYAPHSKITEIDMKALGESLKKSGFKISPIPPKPERIESAAGGSDLTIKALENGMFQINFEYHHGLVKLFSNQSGELSGITEYDPVTRSRLTNSIPLIREIVEKVRVKYPEIVIKSFGLKEAVSKWEKVNAADKASIDQLDGKLAEDIDLFGYQNEFVRFIEKSGGNCIIAAEMGCISGDAIIVVNRGGGARKRKLKDFYQKFNGFGKGPHWDQSIPSMVSSVGDNGELRLNQVIAVLDKGLKKVFKITAKTKNKTYSLVATGDHEFLTPDGFIRLDKLSIGSFVMVNGVATCSLCKEQKRIHKDDKCQPHMRIHEAEIVSIVPAGEDHVYDIVMNDPYRNFIASGFAVHNCGKTPITLAWLAAHGKSALVVCPKVVRGQWLSEADRFFPGVFKTAEIRSGKPFPDLTGVNLISINFELVSKYQDRLSTLGIDCLVIDESHNIANESAGRTVTCMKLAKSFQHKILLSGTAIKNKKAELYTQIEIVRPGFYRSKQELKSAAIGNLWHKMADFYRVKTKAEVLKDLPPKISSITSVEVDGCPDLYEGMQIGDYAALRADVAVAKVPAAIAFVEEILDSSDSCVIVFTESLEAAEKIAEHFGDQCWHHRAQDNDARRQMMKDDFNLSLKKEWSGRRVFVTTRQSCKEGANLTRADKVVFNDLPWNPANLRQAEDRAHRVGIVAPVNVYWLKVKGNQWDEKVTGIMRKKYDISKKVLEGKQVTAAEKAWMEKEIAMEEVLKGVKA